MRFQDPVWLVLLVVIPFLFWLGKSRKTMSISYSSIDHLHLLADRTGMRLTRLLVVLKYLILILMILAMSRPQLTSLEKEVLTEGVDIILLTDVSASMAAEDLKPRNRLEVAKTTVQGFIEKRQGDHIGLVVFGGKAFTYCPLTLDYGTLNSFVGKMELGMAGDGTAIGMAIATGVNRLKNSSSKSKIIILLTDGENNAGEIDPLSAAELASSFGVKVYTIGVGKKGGAPIPYIDPRLGKTYYRNPNGSVFMTKLDEDLLKQLATSTQGQYFRATDSASLKRIYEIIDQLEKTEKKIKQYHHYHDLFPILLWVSFGLFLGYLVIKDGVLRMLP